MANKILKTGIEINTEVKNLEDIDKVIKALEQSGVNVDKLRKQSEELSETWEDLGEEEQSQALKKMQGELDKAANKTGRLEKAATSLKAVWGGMLALFAGNAAVGGVSGFFRTAVSGAASLEAQLSKVKAVSGATDEQMRAIAASAEQLGATTKYTATEAAQGFEILARAGLDTQQSLTAIPSVLDLAQASGIGLADAAGFITKTVSGMNLEMSESGHVADVLAKAAASANTDVAGLGQALSYAAPTANSLGVSLEDTVAIIGKFADSGIDASRAGTALNSVMAQFSNPASKFRQELSAIGINTGDFVEALRQLEASGQRGANSINAVGLEAGPALKALLAQGLSSVDELSGELKNADGTAKNMANTMSDNLPGAITELGSAWDSLKNNLGKPLLEPIKEQVNKLAQTFRTWVADGTVASIGQSIATGFEAAVNALTKFGGYLPKIITTMGLVKAATVAYNASLGKLVTASKTATTASKALLTTLRGFAGLGLGVLVVGISYAYDQLASSVDKVRKAHEKAQSAMVAGNVLLEETNIALRDSKRASDDYLASQQAALEKELAAADLRIKGYEKQKQAAQEKARVDEKTIALADQAITEEKKRQAVISETVTALATEIKARTDAKKAAEDQRKANQASIAAWEAITGSIDKAAEAQLKIPKRSQEILDGLAQLKTASGETGKNIEYLFTQALKEIETPEALRIARIQLDELREAGRLSALAYHDLVDAIKNKSKELPDAISEADVALKQLGFTAKELQSGISESAEKTIAHFATAAEKFGNDAEQMQVIYQAALAKMTNAREIEALNAKFAEISKNSKLSAEEIKTIGQAGIDAANAATPAFKQIANSIAKATQTEPLEKYAAAAKKAFEGGDIDKSQYEALLADLATKTQALADAEKTATTTKRQKTQVTQADTAATKANADATQENTEAVQDNAQANALSSESAKRSSAVQMKLGKALASNTNTWKIFNKTLKEAYKVEGYYSFINAHEAAWDAVRKLRGEIQRAAAAEEILAQKVDAGTVTMADLSDVAQRAAAGIGRLDDAQLNKLNATLDKARNKIKALKDEARQAAQDTEDRLLEATGSESDKINRRFEREIKDLQSKSAKSNVGSADYERAIANLRKLQQIELDKHRKQEQERIDQQRRAQTQENSTGNQALPEPRIPIDTGLAKAFAGDIHQDLAQRDERVAKIAQEQLFEQLRNEYKRLPR